MIKNCNGNRSWTLYNGDHNGVWDHNGKLYGLTMDTSDIPAIIMSPLSESDDCQCHHQ